MIEAKHFLKAEYILKPNRLIKNPEISVILPTYRRADNGLLQRAIDSVLNQTFKRFELIVVDDGSVDSTQEVLRKYVKNDGRVIYVRNNVNCGLPALRVNQGAMIARGKYIAYQFDDDQWVETALQSLYDEIVKHTGLCMVYGSYRAFNVVMRREYIIDRPFSYYDLAKGNYIANNSILHNKELFDECGMYDSHLLLRRVCDWDLWLRFSKRAEICHISEVVSIVETRHSDSLAEVFPYDMGIYRKYMARNRDKQLMPKNYPLYLLNDIKDFGEDRETIYKQHFLKWDSIHDEVRLPKQNRRCFVYMVKNEIDASAEIMVGNFCDLLEGYQIAYLPVGELEKIKFQEGDIVVLCRVLSYAETQVIERLKEKYFGLTLIYAIDDNLFASYKRGEKFKYLAPGQPCYKALEYFVKNADCCIVPNERLECVIKQYNANVKIVSTNIRKEYLRKKSSYEQSEVFRIFFAGGGSRAEEFDKIVDDLIRIANKYTDKVEFTFIGYIPEKMRNISVTKVSFIPFMQSYHQYLNYLSKCNFNLLICPLAKGEFNNMKSPIKLLECCCCGAVGLFSDVTVYDCIKDKKNGFKISEKESWFEKIESIMKLSQKTLRDVSNSALDLVETSYTTEGMVAHYQDILMSAKLRGRLKHRAVLFIAGSIKQERIYDLCNIISFFNDIGVELYVATNNIVFQKVIKKVGNIIKFISYSVRPDSIEEGSIEENDENIVNIIRESGLVYSFEFFSSIGRIASKEKIPYIADITKKYREVVKDNLQKEYCPTAVIAYDIDTGVSWETETGVPYLYIPKGKSEDKKCILESILHTFSINHRSQNHVLQISEKKLEILQNSSRNYLETKIESEMLSLSRPLGKEREYGVFCDKPSITGVALIFESKSEMAMDCDVKLELLYKGTVLRSSMRSVRNIDYNQWIVFEFPLLAGSGGNEFTVRLTLTDNKESSAILSVFEDRRNRGFLYKVFNKLGLKPKGRNALYADFICS